MLKRSVMKRSVVKRSVLGRLFVAGAAVGLAVLATGCGGQPVRTVTHISSWSGDEGADYLYVAYAESQFVSRIKRCLVLEDNAIKCEDQEALNKMLND